MVSSGGSGDIRARFDTAGIRMRPRRVSETSEHPSHLQENNMYSSSESGSASDPGAYLSRGNRGHVVLEMKSVHGGRHKDE